MASGRKAEAATIFETEATRNGASGLKGRAPAGPAAMRTATEPSPRRAISPAQAIGGPPAGFSTAANGPAASGLAALGAAAEQSRAVRPWPNLRRWRQVIGNSGAAAMLL